MQQLWSQMGQTGTWLAVPEISDSWLTIDLRMQNGRVSPRKTGGVSDKGSNSPAQTAASKPAEVKHGNPSEMNGGGTPVSGTVMSPSSRSPREQGQGDTTSWRGVMPPKIEEGEEPPHPTVLPT